MKNRMKQSVIPDSKTHPKYDSAFKQEAVNLWKSSGKSAATVAAELGIKMERLYVWRAKYVPLPTGEGAETKTREQLLADNAALLRELDHVRQQREILKKTLGILSDPQSNATNGLKR
jgi:transposase